ncbi:MAG TPA: sulfatase [Verrucomicrobiae bacterium]
MADAATKRPNILFAIADDWSYGHAGVYGAKWVKTPGFDRVAKEGLLFQNAFTPNAKCAPSRSMIITGRYSWQLGEAANHICYFPAKFKSVVEVLGENGYTTAFTGKGWGPGEAKDANGKVRQMTGKPYQKRKAEGATTGIGNIDYAGNFADFLAEAPKDQPWFFWYGSFEPHRAYEYGSGVTKGGKKLSDIDRVPAYWPDNETTRNDMLDYAFEVEHTDNHLVRMLETLEKRGELENTIVIVTSDHGMPFPRVKGQVYEDSNHVPLAIRWPAGIKKSGRVINDYVNFTDLAPTFLELAQIGFKKTGMAVITGQSLSDILNSEKNGQVNPKRDHVLVGKERHDVGSPNDVGYPVRGIIKDNVLFLQNFEPERWPACNPETGYLNCDAGAIKSWLIANRTNLESKKFWSLSFGKRPAEELYDLKQDPDCVVNLASSVVMEKKKQALKQQMEQELKAQGDPRMFGNGKVFDEYVYADERTRNFYERFMKGEKLKAGWVIDSDFEKGPVE